MEQNETNSLKHHGILGMKWGVRRYQNKDGSLTPAGKRKAAKMKDEYAKLTGKRLIRKPTPKSTTDTDQNGKENVNRKAIKDMSDTEVQKRIDRLQKEKQLMGLQNDTASKGEKFFFFIKRLFDYSIGLFKVGIFFAEMREIWYNEIRSLL